MPADRLPKSYVATRHGQVHLRETGDAGAPVLLMIHWTPLSGRMYAAVAPRLAAAGWRVLMPDLLGYGRSDARPGDWSVADWAASLGEVLDARGIASAVVAGGHVGAAVAVELALLRPEAVRAAILDGVPFATLELRATFAAMAAAPRPGTPMVPVERALGLLAEYIPGWRAEGAGVEQLWPVLADYLATDFVSSAPVAAAWDAAARLPRLACPVLLTGATRESMAASLHAAAALLPAAARHRWAGTHPVHDAARATEFAAPLLAFLEGLP